MSILDLTHDKLDSGFSQAGIKSVLDWRKTITKEDEESYNKVDETIKNFYKKVKSNPKAYPEHKLRPLAIAIEKLRNKQRQIMYKYDFRRFVDDIFSEELQDKVPTPEFHEWMYNAMQQYKRVCVVCPRGHGKSSVTRNYILHQILNKKVRFVLILGASEDMAAQNLRWIRDQLVDNAKIIEIYGYLKDDKKWAETEFLTSTGIKVVAKGAGQKVRGQNERGRPDLIYIDDMESDEMVRVRDNRTKLAEWFMKAVMPIRSKDGRFIVTGTILDNDSLLKNIANNKFRDHIKWNVLWFQALYEDKELRALWPDMHPVSELLSIKEVDPETFAQEYQNNPRSGSMAVFKREWFRHYQQEEVDINQRGVYYLGKKLNVIVTTDFAISEKQGADYTVIMATGMASDGYMYVLEYNRFRTQDPYDMISEVFDMCDKWKTEYVAMETVVFLQALKRQLEREMEEKGKYLFIKEVKRTNTTKMARIKGIASPIRLGKMLWLDDHVELEDELVQVTATRLGRHDDIIDCFVKGTIITTKRGNIPIEEVTTNDYVLTPFGYKQVRICGVSRIMDVIKRSSLIGTKDHPIFTYHKGWVRMKSLTDELEDTSKLCLKELIHWRYRKLLNSMEQPAYLWVVENIISVSQIRIRDDSMLKDFMLRFGSFILKGMFLKAIVFTIKTAICLITPTIILSVLLIKNILRSILLKTKKSRCLLQKQRKLKNIAEKLLKSQKSNGRQKQKRLFSVKPVGLQWKHISQVGLNSALTLADINIDEIQGNMFFQEYANTAKLSLQKTIKQTELVDSVPQHVETKQEVYNLNISGVHCYYANNVLVHNCLSDAWQLQMEENTEDDPNQPAFDSLDWYIQQGYFPTEAEKSVGRARRKATRYR